MSIIDRIFRKANLEYPRCLGKGKVDWQDIQRLNRQLKWQPGKCAYCNGRGKVPSETLSKISPDTTYLTINLKSLEKEKLKNGDNKTLKKAELYDALLNNLINFIEQKFFIEHLDVERIADSYLTTEHTSNIFSIERNELINYIEKVIDLKKNSNELK